MPTTSGDPVSTLRAAVKRWGERLGPNLYGLAVSGGGDSMALADAAIEVLGESNVIVMHVDHGLSPGSGKVATEVAAWARSRGVPSIIRNVTVGRRGSLEAAARDARYAALDAMAVEVGCTWVLLAHTQRDQAETVLMRIVRGTGPAGLAGIPAMRGRFVRPFLEVPRATIDAYVAARGLPTWEDPMNADLRIARIRFRERHLPMLREENPALDDALVRLATAAREWTAVLDDAAEGYGTFPIDARGLSRLAPAVRKRAFAIALEQAGLGYDAVHLEQLDKVLLRDAAGMLAVDVPGGRVIRSYDTIDVEHAPHAGGPEELVAPPGHILRLWQPGDRMKPARLKGRSRKLSDLFIDAKVPRSQRRFARVLVRSADGVIVWAEHVGLAWGESEAIVPLRGRTPGSF